MKWLKKWLWRLGLLSVVAIIGVVSVKYLWPYWKQRKQAISTVKQESPSTPRPKHANPKQIDPKQMKLNFELGEAVRRGDLEAMKSAIKAGADIDCCADLGVGTPLMQAAFHKRIDAMRLLLDSGADINLQTIQDGQTVFHKVAFHCTGEETLPLVELLMEKGADATIRDKNGKTPLDYAIRGYGCQRLQNQIIAYAEKQGKISAVRTPSSNKKDPSSDHTVNQQLILAAGDGDIERMKALIKIGADINCPDFSEGTPLMAAVHLGRLEAAKLLLDLGANVNHRHKKSRGWTALRKVAEGCGSGSKNEVENNLKIAELLLERGADLCAFDDHGFHPWVSTIQVRKRFWVRCRPMRMLFLKYSQMRSPLTNTGGRCSREGMNPAFLEYVYDKVLYRRILLGREPLDELKVLIAAGIDENCCEDWMRGRPLMSAAFWRSIEVADLLIALGADPNLQSDFDGGNALHWATLGCMDHNEEQHQKQVQMIQLLMDAGADITVRDHKGDTPVDRAFKNFDCTKLQKVMLEHRDAKVPIASSSDEATSTGPKARSAEAQRHLNNKLCSASSSGAIGEMEDAIRGGADVNCCTEQADGTPLMRAVFGLHVEAVKLLLDSGANVNLQVTWAGEGRTALHTVVKVYSNYGPVGKKALAIAEMLLQKGANANIKNKQGETPLDALKHNPGDNKAMKQLFLQYQ